VSIESSSDFLIFWTFFAVITLFFESEKVCACFDLTHLDLAYLSVDFG
jgi:hypothetical protein